VFAHVENVIPAIASPKRRNTVDVKSAIERREGEAVQQTCDGRRRRRV
jgi:uncharacterized protein Veg